MKKLYRNDGKNNSYKYFFLKLAILFAIVFIFDFVIGNILSHYYFKQQRGADYQTTYAIDSTNADLLIFGSSRANHHYRPDVFEKRINLSYYNVGRDGNFIFYHYAILKAVLKRYAPKIIILDFIHGEFAKNQDSYDRISSLLPYYRSHPEMRPIILLKSPYEKLKLLSRIYPNNSSLLIIAGGNAIFSEKKREDINGYIPLTRVWDNPIQVDITPARYETDSIKIKIYQSFIQDCINSKVTLYIVCSPYFIKSTHEDYSVKLAKEIAKKYHVKFFDYSQDSAFLNNPKLFDDPAHLNKDGAKVFSESIADSILSE
jgi:hypothetical protein